MKLEHMTELAEKDEYAKDLLSVLDSILDEAIDKMTDDFLEKKESVILKKIYPRYDFSKRDEEKYNKFLRAIYGVLRRFPVTMIEKLARTDVCSDEYTVAYKKLATFFGRETRLAQKQPKTFSSADMENLFDSLAERTENVCALKEEIREL